MNHSHAQEIAYIVKAYPRTSETFIANEVRLLEQAGLRLQIFSLLHVAQTQEHGVFKQIQAKVTYLPPLDSLSRSRFLSWMWRNGKRVAASHLRLAGKRPGAYLGCLFKALAMGVKYRKRKTDLCRKKIIKEFLQAGYIAEKILRAPQIKHLHAHFCGTTTTVALFVSRLCTLPFSFSAHAKDIYQQQQNPGDLLQRKIKQAAFVATCTLTNQDHLLQMCASSKPIYRIYHGVNTQLFRPPLRHGTIERPLILSIGRLVPKKGFTYLVQACHHLKQQGHNFDCVIIGDDGGEHAALTRQIRQLELRQTVRLPGPMTQEALLQWYQQATVFALPCVVLDDGDRDGIPNVLLEAMAVGLPVVSTPISGIPEVVHHERNGILVPQRDSVALAAAIETLFTQAALRSRLGEAARQHIHHQHDSARTTVELVRLFQSSLYLGQDAIPLAGSKQGHANV